MVLTLAVASMVLATLDALTTHLGLRTGRLAESNPLADALYRRLPPAGFITLSAASGFLVSLVLARLLGPAGQMGFLAAGALPPLWNAWLIYRTRDRR
jgi:hypothetical protein